MSQVAPERIVHLNDAPVRQEGSFVLYWMQAAQRAHCNHALEYARQQADELGTPLIAIFALTSAFPDAGRRQYAFMLEGLRETQVALAKRGVRLTVRLGEPADVVEELAREACCVVTDRSYSRTTRAWREDLAGRLAVRLTQVETEVVVPVEWASTKHEYAARTLRPRIAKQVPRFLVPLAERNPRHDSLGLNLPGLDLSDMEAVLDMLGLRDPTAPSPLFRGGLKQARSRLRFFLDRHLDNYETLSNDAAADGTSHLSPYLHFGQIAPLEVALAVQEQSGPGAEPFLEQLIVRRELAINHAVYDPAYDSYDSLPDWARATLAKHRRDRREEIYDAATLDAAATGDPYWNAAQRQLLETGWMHNYMRMYWGKRVIAWMKRPEDAFAWLLRTNDRLQLDGRDPNGWTGVAWCFGLHDRPWPERPIYGTVRTMTPSGLKRKFDVDAYIIRWGG